MTVTKNAPLGYTRREDFYYLLFVYIGLGAAVLILNIPLFLYLISTIKQKSKELIVIMSLSLSDISNAFVFLAMGLQRYSIWFEGSEIHFISQSACNRTIVLVSYLLTLQMDNFFQLCIALDRLYAVLLPFKYGQLENGYTLLMVTSPFFMSAIGVITHLIVVSNVPETFIDEICFNTSSLLPGFRLYTALQRILCVLIPFLIYLFIYLQMKMKLGYVSKAGQTNRGMRHLTRTVAYTTIVAVFLVLIPEVVYQFNVFGGLNPSIYFTMILFKKIVSFFIHTLRHRELMSHLGKFLPKKFSVVVLRVQAATTSKTAHTTMTVFRSRKE